MKNRILIFHTDLKERYPIIYFGIIASFAYSIWAIFEEMSSTQHMYITNAIVYGVAFMLSLKGLKYKRGPSIATIVSGISGGLINALILYGLIHYDLTLIYPFVSFGSIIFIGLVYFFLNGSFNTRYRISFLFGIIIAFLGLVSCGIGLSGGFELIQLSQINFGSFILGISISLATGLWIFFAFYAVVKENYTPLAATTWVFFGSFSLSIILIIIDPPNFSQFNFSYSILYSIVAGIAMFFGELATYFGFKSVPGDNQRIQQTLTVFLSNSEVVPITIISALILNYYSIEGIIGTILVVIGLYLVNSNSAIE